MDGHLAPARLLSDALTFDERAHLDGCPRCREGRGDWPAEGAFEDRYEDLGPLGAGGMGEVRRVRDRRLGRVVAMKVLLPSRSASAVAVSRFLEEARVAARLQHPGMVGVIDAGRFADGRVWFTMPEIHGRTFAEVIDEHHRRGTPSLHRLLEVFARVCDAIAWAHDRGVLHRDLKPANVMIGAFGEVLVLDWGLAQVLPDAGHTHAGAVAGTPGYMAPEQALGGPTDARADVFGLGAILHAVLSGGPPGADGDDPPPGPPELVALCLEAVRRDPASRPPAADLAEGARRWLEGAARRERALEVVAEAEAAEAQAQAARERAGTLRAEADAALAGLPPWADEEQKASAWERQDAAAALEASAALSDSSAVQLLEEALRADPTLEEPRRALVERALAWHREVEAAESPRIVEATARLRALRREVGARSPLAVRIDGYLAGDGALTLLTDPPGAMVELERFEVRHRRRVAVPVGTLGRTPLVAVALREGSYLCRIRHPDRAEVRYPVHVPRGGHWDGVPPGEREPYPVPLPVPDTLGEDDCYVPCGWFLAGTPQPFSDPNPVRRVWCDGFVIRRFPVTHAEYLRFLDALCAEGRETDALAFAPRERGASMYEDGPLLYGRDADGRFHLRPDPEGDVWEPGWPVMMIHFGCAAAYAADLADRSGLPWRLPAELEREKAARGVDGRRYPWGGYADPSWSNGRDSRPGRPLPVAVDTFPLDVSVYGVRGVGGNVQDWCADPYVKAGPAVAGDRVVVPVVPARPDLATTARRPWRGGYWNGPEGLTRCATRAGYEPALRLGNLSFRMCRSLSLDG